MKQVTKCKYECYNISVVESLDKFITKAFFSCFINFYNTWKNSQLPSLEFKTNERPRENLTLVWMCECLYWYTPFSTHWQLVIWILTPNCIGLRRHASIALVFQSRSDWDLLKCYMSPYMQLPSGARDFVEPTDCQCYVQKQLTICKMFVGI